MQTLDVQIQNPAMHTGPKSVKGEKTGAETARNGSSFLAMIEKMIAGAREGMADMNSMSAVKAAARGAGDGEAVPGDDSTLIKPGSGKKSDLASMIKKDARMASNPKLAAKAPESLTKAESLTGTPASSGTKAVIKGKHPLTGGVVQDHASAESEKAKVAEKPGDEAVPRFPDTEATGASLLAFAQNRPNAASAGSTETEISVPSLKNAALTITEDAAEKTAAPTVRKDRKASIQIHDKRTETSDAITDGSPLIKTVEIKNDHTADMTIGFRTAENGQSAGGEAMRLAERHDNEGQSFSSMLSRELRDNAADFVKTGQIVLRDNNVGLIRLTLHPESLGNVKISLELSGDHKISGKIVVSSQEAYDAFNENLDGLSDAFTQGGFESAGFDLSWSGSGNGESSRGNETLVAAISPFYASSIPDVMSSPEVADTVIGGFRPNAVSAIDVFA